MIRSSRVLVAACAVLVGNAAVAAAATKAGVTMPDTMQVGGTTVQLNGLGLRSFTLLQIRGYVAGLYLAKPTHDAEEALSEPGPKALVIHYIRGASTSQVHDLYMESSRNYCAHHSCSQSDKVSFETLLGTVRAVKPGDSTSFLISDGGVQVLFNGNQIAHLDDPAFGRVILDSDLGASPPSAELKNGLLGLNAS
jgi:hypothetical protein